MNFLRHIRLAGSGRGAFPPLLSLYLAGFSLLLAAEPAPLCPKVVVVTMFEVGADTGDTPGEFQLWVERENLTREFPLPAAYHSQRSAVRAGDDMPSRL